MQRVTDISPIAGGMASRINQSDSTKPAGTLIWGFIALRILFHLLAANILPFMRKNILLFELISFHIHFLAQVPNNYSKRLIATVAKAILASM